MHKTMLNGRLLAAFALLLAQVSTRADQNISFGYTTAAQAHVNLAASDCDNSNGPTITLGGSLLLGEYKANLTYYQNVRKNLTLVGQDAEILLTSASPITIPKSPHQGGV